MQQLSNLDAVFLAMETAETPGHIGGLAILDPGTHPDDAFDFERFVDFAAERLARCPRFTWQLQEVPLGLDQPYWVENEAVDLRRHIHRMALPAPGGQQELANLANTLFPTPLDRTRPLWEMFFIEGLQGNRVALLWKLHHCMMDGAAGAGLVEFLFDLEPTPAHQPLVALDDRAEASTRVGTLELLANSLWKSAGRPVAALRHLATAGRQLAEQLHSEGVSAVTMAPRTPFNGTLSSRRSIAWSRLSLERVKSLKRALDVTVNDVVLELTGSAVRQYLDERNELPADPLFVGVPVSVRAEGDQSIGNQISEMTVQWGTHLEDPVERLFTIHESAALAKGRLASGGLNLVEAMADTLPPGLMSWMSRGAGDAAESMPLPSNAVVSNVPMSPVPLYIAGAKMESIVPMSLLAPTQGFNITVVSYAGEMHFGVIADPDLVDNVWEIADAIPKALIDLEEAAQADPRFAG